MGQKTTARVLQDSEQRQGQIHDLFRRYKWKRWCLLNENAERERRDEGDSQISGLETMGDTAVTGNMTRPWFLSS